jgi:hypothetical protein
MVKGITRQVIMVDSPDPSIFEKAIFILKDSKSSVAYEDILTEAQLIADSYLKNNIGSRKLKIPPLVYAFAGAAVTGAAWLCAVFIK